MPEKFELTPEQRQIQKERTLHDAGLLERGAEYNEKGVLMLSDEQMENVQKHLDNELMKAYTEKALSYSGDDERILSDQELIKSGAKYVIDKISRQTLLEVDEKLRLELSGRGEKVEDAVNRIIDNIKKLELTRGSQIELHLRDNSTRVGYYDDAGKQNPEKAFNWNDDKTKAYLALGGWINQGSVSFGIRGHQYIPAQAIESIEMINKARSADHV